MTEKKDNWLLYALITMITWGVWGAFSDQTTLPKNLVYVVWALSMVPCALVALANIKFKLDVRTKPALLSMAVGLLGAGGQLVLFLALDYAPAYLVMPMISVAPIVTVLLSAAFLKERVSKMGIIGIVLAFVALVCFALPDNTDGAVSNWIWIVYASVVFICWGVQAFVMKLAKIPRRMRRACSCTWPSRPCCSFPWLCSWATAPASLRKAGENSPRYSSSRS